MSKLFSVLLGLLFSFGVAAQQQYIGPAEYEPPVTQPPITLPPCPPNSGFLQPAYAGSYFSLTDPNFNLTFWSSGTQVVVRSLNPSGGWFEGSANFTGDGAIIVPLFAPGSRSPGGRALLCGVRFANCTKMWAYVDTFDYTTNSLHLMTKEHTYDGRLVCTGG